jgi:hypothetical protein
MDLVHPSPDGTPAAPATPVIEVPMANKRQQWQKVPLYGGVNYFTGDIFDAMTLVSLSRLVDIPCEMVLTY